MASAQELLSAIEADPDAVEPYLVYADWLQEHGDPQGELIALQHRLLESPGDGSAAEAAEALIRKHRKRFLGELAEHEGILWEWRLGFLRGARVLADLDDAGPSCRQLLELPLARFLRELVVFGRTGVGEAERAELDRLRPRTLPAIRYAERHEDLAAARQSTSPALWLALATEDPGELVAAAELESLEWLELSTELEALPEALARLTRLRRLDIDWCYGLRAIPDEIFAIESLGHVSMYDCHSLPKSYHMGRMNNLLRGFVRAQTPARRRVIELNLLLGREAGVHALASVEDLLAALDSNVGQVREAALAALGRKLEDPLAKRPIGKGSSVALLGAVNTDRPRLKSRLEAIGAKLTLKLDKATSHVLLGLKPGGKQRALGELPVLLEAQLLRGLERAARPAGKVEAPAGEAGSAPAHDVEAVRADLRARDEGSAARAIAALKESGVPSSLLGELLLVCQDVSFKGKVRSDAKKLFALHAPEKLKRAVEKHLKTSLLLESLGEGKRAERIADLCREGGTLEPVALARLLLERARVGLMAILAQGSSAEIAAALELLRNGDELDLSTRELYDLPAELGAMKGLRALDLSGNHLGKLPPPLLALEGLERLDLTGNTLRATKGIGALASLRALELGHNRLARVPTEVLALSALEALGLASEQYVDFEVRIQGIPDEIRRLARLKRLDLTYAVIESFPEGFFALALEELRLFSASLPAEVPEGFARLERLRTLDLRYSAWSDAKQVKRLAKLLPGCEIER